MGTSLLRLSTPVVAMTGTDPASRFRSVLDDGLPELPRRIPAGAGVPVAFWMGINFGAVVVAERGAAAARHPYLTITYAYRFGDRGWERPQTLGGGVWPGGEATWADLGHREVQLVAGTTESPGGWPCRRIEGFAGADAAWIELSEGLTTTMHAIAPSGAFVAIVDGDGPATFHVLDHAGLPIATHVFPDDTQPGRDSGEPGRAASPASESSTQNQR